MDGIAIGGRKEFFMPRRARRDLGSEYLHIIVQGIDKKYIFDKKIYMEKYHDLLIEKVTRYDVKILGYCIMNNHAHMLMYSPNINEISKYMKAVNSEYAQYYNKNENRVGYVFRDRYLSEPIISEKQLYNCLSYIHFNPVNAHMVSHPSQYKYSSYMEYINENGIVDNETIIKIFGSVYDYMSMFKFIHYGIGEAMEPKEEKSTYIKSTELMNIEICSEDDLIEKCREMKRNGISNRKIAETLSEDRNKINKIVKENCQ